MPQSTQHSLVYILLLWTTIISIIQVVFTILFFTTGRTGLSQNSTAVEPAPHISQPLHHSTPSPSSKSDLRLGPGKMITFTANRDRTGRIEWVPKSTRASVITVKEDGLKIVRDGYYFLNLQVSSCKNSKNLEYTVRLKKNKDKVLLEGWINTKTNTTGVLSKVEELSASVYLEVNIDPPIECLDSTESATHLDIIFMDKTW